jgi:pimeloyl-ACP methyl ester carboxylesterase
VRNFGDYLELENRLFEQLDELIYSQTAKGQPLNRFSPGSLADPRNREPNWNRSFELTGRGAGAVLLLHGMSDSPYSLRALGQVLHEQGYHVIGLRLPGHGTAPSGMKYLSWGDMAAAVDLAVDHLATVPGGDRLHIIGYSNGAALALDYSLRALEEGTGQVPASLVLVSPAIRVSATAILAGWKNSFSALPGLRGMAWLTLMNEFDPYKYNSFSTNAGAQVHRGTWEVERRLNRLAEQPGGMQSFPPVLAMKSTVDATVSTDAVVDKLLKLLPAERNELVLFDINRYAPIVSTVLVSDPGPFTERLLKEQNLPFAVSFVSNENVDSRNVVVRRKNDGEPDVSSITPLGVQWPAGVVSLSHVALPFPPDDPIYGPENPEDGQIHLGSLAITGERGLLNIPADFLLRMRYNPFYGYLEQRVTHWIDNPDVEN